MSNAPTTPSTPQGGGDIYIAFVPWVLFSVISERDTVATGAVVALVAAVAIALRGVLRGHPKELELGAVAAFVVFTVVALITDPSSTDFLARYARAIAAGFLSLIAFASLLRTPFTEQYARESVSESLWNTPRFKAVNRQLSFLWAFVFLAMVPSHVVAGLIDTHRGNTIFNWVIPIALIVFAVKQTAKASGAAHPGATPAGS